MTIFGREPAVINAFFASVLGLASALFFHFTPDVQGVINAAFITIMGVVTAYMVKDGTVLTAGLAATKALIALALAFGLNLSGDLQSAILIFVNMGGAFFLRTQVIAPNGPNGVVRTNAAVNAIKAGQNRIA